MRPAQLPLLLAIIIAVQAPVVAATDRIAESLPDPNAAQSGTSPAKAVASTCARFCALVLKEDQSGWDIQANEVVATFSPVSQLSAATQRRDRFVAEGHCCKGEPRDACRIVQGNQSYDVYHGSGTTPLKTHRYVGVDQPVAFGQALALYNDLGNAGVCRRPEPTEACRVEQFSVQGTSFIGVQAGPLGRVGSFLLGSDRSRTMEQTAALRDQLADAKLCRKVEPTEDCRIERGLSTDGAAYLRVFAGSIGRVDGIWLGPDRLRTVQQAAALRDRLADLKFCRKVAPTEICRTAETTIEGNRYLSVSLGSTGLIDSFYLRPDPAGAAERARVLSDQLAVSGLCRRSN